MFGAVNIILIFLLFRTICGQLPLPGSEYAKYRRNPPTYNLNNIERTHDNPMPLLDLQGGENVQKLVPKQSKLYEKEGHKSDDEKNLGPEGSYPEKPKKGKKKGETAAPQNVNRVQELTGQLWPMGIVPYFVDTKTYDLTTVKRIVKAMSAIESVSCVIFRELEKKPENSLDAWLHITNPNNEKECAHVFSTVNGAIEVVLGFECLHPDEILHSLLHALGFRDEVAHPHRDDYIRVLWNNIQPKYRKLFRIQHEDASYKLVEYDPMSIMHFHDRAFSENGGATIASIVPGLQISSTTSLSQLDIMRLKLAFSHECNKRSIGDLIITCKKSLTPQKSALEKKDKTGEENENEQDENGDTKEADQRKDEKMKKEDDNIVNDENYGPDDEKHNSDNEKHSPDKEDAVEIEIDQDDVKSPDEHHGENENEQLSEEGGKQNPEPLNLRGYNDAKKNNKNFTKRFRSVYQSTRKG